MDVKAERREHPPIVQIIIEVSLEEAREMLRDPGLPGITYKLFSELEKAVRS